MLKENELPISAKSIFHPINNINYFFDNINNVVYSKVFRKELWKINSSNKLLEDFKYIEEYGAESFVKKHNDMIEASNKRREDYQRKKREEEENEYKMMHTAPDYDPDSPNSGANVIDVFGSDIYSDRALKMFGHKDDENIDMDIESLKIINNMYKKPSSKITIYRAVPSSLPDDIDINTGDWITISKKYAELHGKSNLKNDYKIIEKEVLPHEIFTDGNSIHEWGWFPDSYKPIPKKLKKSSKKKNNTM